MASSQRPVFPSIGSAGPWRGPTASGDTWTRVPPQDAKLPTLASRIRLGRQSWSDAMISLGSSSSSALRAKQDGSAAPVPADCPAAVRALGRLGKPARKAIPDVRRLLTDERPTVRAAAKETIGQLED